MQLPCFNMRRKLVKPLPIGLRPYNKRCKITQSPALYLFLKR